MGMALLGLDNVLSFCHGGDVFLEEVLEGVIGMRPIWIVEMLMRFEVANLRENYGKYLSCLILSRKSKCDSSLGKIFTRCILPR